MPVKLGGVLSGDRLEGNERVQVGAIDAGMVGVGSPEVDVSYLGMAGIGNGDAFMNGAHPSVAGRRHAANVSIVQAFAVVRVMEVIRHRLDRRAVIPTGIGIGEVSA